MNGNRLAELPDGAFAGLPRLVTLDLSRNSLATIPAGAFTGLFELEYLAMRTNYLDSLPAGVFSDQAQLAHLNLSYNRLLSLPEGVFTTLVKLSSLYLHYNNLSALHEGVFSGLAELDTLYLNDNRLSTLPVGTFSGVPRLAEANLTYNNIEPLPISLGLVKVGSSQFKAVALQGAPFTLVVPVIISDGGTIDSGQETITIPAGTLESAPLGVERAAGREEAVQVDFGDFPLLPSRHTGYSLEQDGSLPLQVLPSISPGDASLNGLSVSGAMLDPAFSPDETLYSTTVGNNVSSVSVTSTTGVADASVSYFDENDVELEDANTTIAGFQFDLMEGENMIRIRVTSENGQSIRTYAVVVTRDKSTNVCGRTPQVRDAIVAAVPGAEACTSVTTAQLSEIIRLDFDRNRIASLKPDDFAGLNKLATLDLRNNQLETIPVNLFATLSELRYLSLRGNPLSGVSAENFAGLTSLRTLDLGDIGLTTLPGGVFSALPNLGRLVLVSNRLSSLTEEVFEGLPKLWHLDLARNRFSKLPPGLFSGLSKLEELDLYENRLRSLAVEEFANLRILRRLNFRENLLSELPAGFFSEMDTLTQLDLSGNLFASMPTGVFSGLTQLEDLDFEHNLVNPLPLPVSIETAGENEFKAVVFSAAPFALELSVGINDSEGIDSDSIAVTVPAGAIESAPVALTRLPEDGQTVSVDITDLPALPDEHKGYALTRNESLPLLFDSSQAAQPPGQVTGVEATAGTEELDVSWNAVADASGYKVQWKSTEETYDDQRQVVTASGDTVNYTITGLVAGAEYTIRVIATKAHAEDGLPSEEFTGVPEAEPPAQVTGVAVNPGLEELAVSWMGVSDADGYKVQWKSGSEEYAGDRQVALLGGETTSYTIIDLTNDTEYTIRVIATREHADDGEPSDEVTGTPASPDPDPDVNADGTLDGDDAQVMYQAYASSGKVGDGESGGTPESRRTLLSGLAGVADPTDDDLKAMLRKANVWRYVGLAHGGDINEDGAIDGDDAFVMYYAYEFADLVGDGETGGTARHRRHLLASRAGTDDPSDEDLKKMLRRANKLREDFG